MPDSPCSIPVIIDGPNFINRLLELDIEPSHLARQLSIRGMMELIDNRLETMPGLNGNCTSAEFVCSPKRFGPNSARFSEEQQKLLLDRIRAEVGVYVDCISIPGSAEKGVDTTIAGQLQDLGGKVQAAILVSADRDYIPTLKRLRHTLNVILFSVANQPPVELQNEAYASIILEEDYRSLFSYSYPSFHINDLNEEKLAILFAETDDRHLNQLRVSHSGDVYMEKGGGTEFLSSVKFRFESFCAFNGYAGPIKAGDRDFIAYYLSEIRLGWEKGASGYYDYPISSVYKDTDASE